ncbi:TonB-dependent receptor [Sphingomonas sp.]|uniref:TonB-dependent siderophore receptor n=1 Tax=Sphingomonas sp. TaxID=28214 RepID=UPI0025DDC4B8|nr:TonB-dependent receptor [Sphingomonas sp.]
MALLVRASALAVAGGLLMPAVAQAQSVSGDERVTVNVPAGPLGPALEEFGKQAGVALVYPAELAQGLSTNGVSGTMSVQDALVRLLSGTGLTMQFSGGAINLVRAGGEGGERVLGAVRVQGSQDGGSSLAGATPVNGINGSRDVTATEGTGSYTSNALTVGSKTAQSIKDVPMSVSVLTDQQIKDQNITTLTDAMQNMSGVTVNNAGIPGSEEYYSRGYQITQVQIDGGAAQILGSSMGAGIQSGRYTPIIDMSLYDHVELVRGASGTFNAYGDPSGVINLVRKKPLDHAQLSLEFQLGSWARHRVSADVTGPLGFGGKLRGRLIATHQDNDYFFDITHSDLNILSGTLEYDLTPTTLLSAGINYQTHRQDGARTGIPRYLDGTLVDLPRSTNWTFPWVLSTQENLEYFGQLDQRIGNNWTLKFKGTRISQKGLSEGVSAGSDYVLTSDLAHSAFAKYGLGAIAPRTKQMQYEITLDGAFRLFSQTQKVVVGANYSMADQGGSAEYYGGSLAANGIPTNPFARYYFNPFAFDPSILVDPTGWMDPSSKSFYVSKQDVRIVNAYVNFEFTPFARVRIVSGAHYSAFRSRGYSYDLCTGAMVTNGVPGCTAVGVQPNPRNGQLYKGQQFSWPPSVVAKYDFSSNLTGYAGYTDIYQDQSFYRTQDGAPLPPLTGGNFEGGLKWLSPNKKFNIAFSGYYIRKKNQALGVCDYDPSTDVPDCTGPASGSPSGGELVNQTYCCYAIDPNWRETSYGVDFEVSGEIRKGWQVSASYNWNKTLSAPGGLLFDGKRAPLQSFIPPQQFRFWSTYRFDEGSPLDGVVLGFGARGQTKTFVTTYYCPRESVTPNGCSVSIYLHPVYFTDPGHVIFSASLGYKINDQLSLNVELENLLDNTYLSTIGTLGSNNYYGSPRGAIVTLRGKF